VKASLPLPFEVLYFYFKRVSLRLEKPQALSGSDFFFLNLVLPHKNTVAEIRFLSLF